MSYVINNTRGQIVAVVADGTINTAATPVTLVGRGVTSYGEYENENYVWILENFANSSAPPNPVVGQLWYNTATNVMSVWNTGNTWATISSNVSTTIKTTATTYSSLPSASTAGAGTRAFITDGNTATFANAVAGGGSNSVPVYSDGINWRVG